MQANHYRFGEQHRILSGRKVGSELRERILFHFQHHGLDDAYYIDLTEVEFLDLSCADELIHGLLEQIKVRSGGSGVVVLAGVSGLVRENIRVVLELRQPERRKESGQKPIEPRGAHAVVLQAVPKRVPVRRARPHRPTKLATTRAQPGSSAAFCLRLHQSQ